MAYIEKRVAWLEKKAVFRKVLQAVDERPRSTPAILDGDENATTPVESEDLGKWARLHPFSAVALSLLRLLNQEEAETNDIVRLVQSDSALAAETLAFVNSSLFGMRGGITALHHAVVMLGADHIRSLATTLAMRSLLKGAPKPAVVRRLWRHGVATGIIGSELAPVYGVSPDLAHTAGILHDVGRFGLLAKHGESYVHLVLGLYDDVDAILQAERQVCASDHCEVGQRLCEAWKLPTVFQEVAAEHHRAKEQAGMTGLVHVACALADDLAFAAISHRGPLTLEKRVAESVPTPMRAEVMKHFAGVEERILASIAALDF